MTIFDEIVQIVPGLRPEQQRQVLDVVIKLRDAHKLPDLTVPPAGASDAAWDAWSERVGERSALAMEDEKLRLQALGIVDEHGTVLTAAVPDDMLPSSKTSVET